MEEEEALKELEEIEALLENVNDGVEETVDDNQGNDYSINHCNT